MVEGAMNFLQKTIQRFRGESIDVQSETTYSLPTSAVATSKFGKEHASLIRKRQACREWMKRKGISQIKADRK